MLVFAGSAAAQVAPAQDQECISSICIVADSGLIISAHNPDEIRPAASMVKMVLMFMVAEGVRDDRWTYQTQIPISENAARMGGTQVAVKAGEVYSLGDLMLAVAVASANDGAVAVAEGLWGSEEDYLEAANARVRELGMLDSTFHSVNGLPPDPGEKLDETSARDMAILGQYCVQDPIIMSWVGNKEVQFRETGPPNSNTNKLLWRMAGCDGIKTGYTRAAGFCVTATAQREGIRLISVVMGCQGKYGRFNEAERLIEEGFAQLQRVLVLAKGQPVEPPLEVANCATSRVNLTAADDVFVTIKRTDVGMLEVVPEQPAKVSAPLAAGVELGKARILYRGATLGVTPLLVAQDLPAAGVGWKMKESIFRGRNRQ